MRAEFRKAEAEDAKEVAKLAVEMWTSHTLEELTEELFDAVENENSVVYLMTVNEVIAGFAQCGLRHDYVEGAESSPVGYLEGIFVKKEYRTQGFAKKLLSCCEKWAREMRCTQFASDCEIDNEVSRKFHIKSGFKEANRIICFVKEI